jgi:hypothetical protein
LQFGDDVLLSLLPIATAKPPQRWHDAVKVGAGRLDCPIAEGVADEGARSATTTARKNWANRRAFGSSKTTA